MKFGLKILVVIQLLMAGCNPEPELRIFEDFVETEKIEKVYMHNNSGSFELNEKQIKKFRKDISGMKFNQGTYKTGGITMDIIIKGRKYYMSANSHGQYIEVSSNMMTKNQHMVEQNSVLYFETGGVNFDNYKKNN